jgi:hypothetical protein
LSHAVFSLSPVLSVPLDVTPELWAAAIAAGIAWAWVIQS